MSPVYQEHVMWGLCDVYLWGIYRVERAMGCKQHVVMGNTPASGININQLINGVFRSHI